MNQIARSKVHTSHVHQDHLIKQLHNLFPDVKTHVDARKQVALKYPTSGSYLEVDIWIPEHNIAVEFQDTYHYVTTWYTQYTLGSIKKSDYTKKSMTQQNELTLIVIPCWWDGKLESLKAAVHFQRPELFPTSNSNPPIPLNPPRYFFPSIGAGEDVGELMIASFPAAEMTSFANSVEGKTWWMGEKYDGIRFCWNPKKRSLFTRNGKQILVPQKIIRYLPSKFLDGEIWFGRGSFELTHNIIHSSGEMVYWDLLRLLCFDVVRTYLPFEMRFKEIIRNIKVQHPFCIVVTRALCLDKIHLNFFTGEIIQFGGEGVIMQRVSSLYDSGRTPSLIKLKTAFVDKDALVVAVNPDSVNLKLPNGRIFTVPLPSANLQIGGKLQKGDIVTFSYEIHARREIPANPTIVRIRTDVSWEDVVASYVSEEKFLNEHSLIDQVNLLNLEDKPKHAPDQMWNKMENRRKLFEEYAKENRFEYTSANIWYSQPIEKIMAFKGVKYAIHYHNKSVSKTLLDLFPDIGLEKAKLISWPWNYASKRRQFFENYAVREKFDFLVAENWYSQSADNIRAAEGAEIVLSYYEGLISTSLIELFPTVSFNREKLKIKLDWATASSRRQVFEEYARIHSFDPLIPSCWYSESRKRIMAHAKILIDAFYGGSVSQALLQLFPEIGLDKSQFWSSTWRVPARRRAFFEDFAKENKFDPLAAVNWYSQSREKIMSKPEASKVIAYHKNSISTSLLELFPDIGLDKSKLWNPGWYEKKNRRKFFVDYATENSFDPLVAKNWYMQSRSNILAKKGGNTVIKHYKGNMTNALMDLFPDMTGIEDSKFFTTAHTLRKIAT